jgi:hypothetical protein
MATLAALFHLRRLQAVVVLPRMLSLRRRFTHYPLRAQVQMLNVPPTLNLYKIIYFTAVRVFREQRLRDVRDVAAAAATDVAADAVAVADAAVLGTARRPL